jgi:hypothetical protein
MLTREQTRKMPGDNMVKQVQGELEQSHRPAYHSPLQHFEEEMPHEKEMFDHADKSNEEIIKEKHTQIQEIKDDLAKANHMVALLKQENKLLNLNAMHQNTSPGHPSSNKEKDKGEKLMSLQAVEFEKNKEYWIGRVNEYLENLLKRANKDTKMQRNMVRHYFTKNLI